MHPPSTVTVYFVQNYAMYESTVPVKKNCQFNMPKEWQLTIMFNDALITIIKIVC